MAKYTTEALLEKAKKLMEWDDERYGEPTLLEYLRYYRGGVIGERHIEAVIIAQHHAQLEDLEIQHTKELEECIKDTAVSVLDELKRRLPDKIKVSDVPYQKDRQPQFFVTGKNEAIDQVIETMEAIRKELV